jgi:steroid delta-isomerase-like uncharacterized protein
MMKAIHGVEKTMTIEFERKADLAQQIWNGSATPEIIHLVKDEVELDADGAGGNIVSNGGLSKAKQNLSVVSRIWNEIWNTGALEVCDEVFSSDYIGHLPIMTVHGPAEFENLVKIYLEAFPDVNLTVEDSFAINDRVTVRWVSRGTHLGPMMGIAPSKNKIEVMGISVFRMSGGQVAEEWEGFDTLGMMQQIGAIPKSN